MDQRIKTYAFRALGCSLGALMGSCLVMPAFAQGGGAASANEKPDKRDNLEEVIVTAQFRKQNLQKTPIAITAVTGDTLQARSQTNIAEVAAQAPNVNLKPAQGSFGPTLQAFIRGVGQNDFNFALEPGVGVYVDDVYYSTTAGSLFDLLDLDRIEILRGPQGTLAGQNSIGGAIKLYSKKPDSNGGGFGQFTYGSFNRVDVRAGVGYTLVPSKLFGRSSGVFVRKDGYVDRYDYGCSHPGSGVPAYASGDCHIGTEGGKNYVAIRQAFRWTPTDRIEVNLIGDYTNDKSESTPNTLLYVGTSTAPGASPISAAARTSINGVPLGTAAGSIFIPYSPFGSYARDTFTNNPYVNYSSYCETTTNAGSRPFCAPNTSRLDTWGGSANIKFDLNDKFSITSITAYRYYSGQWTIDEGTPIDTYMLQNWVSHRQLSEELRLNGKLFRDKVDFTLGGFWFDQKSHYGGRIGVRTINFFTERDYIPGNSKAVFSNIEWHVTSKLDLIGGVRYSKMEKIFQYGRLPDIGSISGTTPVQVAALNNVTGKYRGSHVDYRAAIQYQWTPGLMTYAQFSTGFKGGGVNPRPFTANQVIAFRPETLNAYEVGMKSDLFDNRLRVNLSAFFNQYNNIVVNATTCPFTPATPCFLPLNAGRARVQGIELETVVHPFRGASIEGSVSYLDFQYKDINPLARSAGITADMKAPFTAAWQYSLGAQYEFDLDRLGRLTPRIDLAYQGSFFTGATNVTPYNKVPPHTVLNGRISWVDNDDKWQLALEVKNMTDALYYYSYRDDRGSSQTIQGAIAPPREFAFTVRRNF